MTREKGTLPRAYLRVDPNMPITHPSPGDFMRLLGAAAHQPRRGRFKSLGVLSSAIGKPAAKRSLERGDVVGHDGEDGCLNGKERRELCPKDGHLYVAGWDEWQEGDWTVGERMSRVRARKRNPTVTPDTAK